MECENCKKIEEDNENLEYEIDCLRSQITELEDEKQDILDNPEAYFDWGDLD